jgi:hypothetical protein
MARSSAAASAKRSECISCPPILAAVTGRNVPAPTCSATRLDETARARSASSVPAVKWRPAVGAATEPVRAGWA